jgi:hypothetical protein
MYMVTCVIAKIMSKASRIQVFGRINLDHDSRNSGG